MPPHYSKPRVSGDKTLVTEVWRSHSSSTALTGKWELVMAGNGIREQWLSSLSVSLQERALSNSQSSQRPTPNKPLIV